MSATLIRNGRVITASDDYVADVLLRDGVIDAIGQHLEVGPEVQVIDASHRYVLPGGVDTHVHLENPIGITVTCDSFASGTRAAAFGGTVFYFGVPDDDSYPISMRTMLRNNLTLKSGVTLDRRRVLAAADAFAREHPDLLARYVTHTFGIDEVQDAFEFACRPTPGRVKIAIAGS